MSRQGSNESVGSTETLLAPPSDPDEDELKSQSSDAGFKDHFQGQDQDNGKQKLLRLPRLETVFKAFVKTPLKDHELKIRPSEVQRWFAESGLFKAVGSKLSSNAVSVVWNRMKLPSLSFKEFKQFILMLGEYTKMNADSILYRLRLVATPELQSCFLQLTLPEGSVDRLVDVYRDLSYNGVDEIFYDMSNTAYVEPVCRGGIRARFKDDAAMFDDDLKRIVEQKKLEKEARDDELRDTFVKFAKDGDYYSDGRTISLTNLIKWMKQAELFNGDSEMTVGDAVYLYKRLYTLESRLSFYDIQHYIREFCDWMEEDTETILQRLKNCGDPARCSISMFKMKVHKSVADSMVDMLGVMSRAFEENFESYVPTSADRPEGHTPKSRDRFFVNQIEGRLERVGQAKAVVDDSRRQGSAYEKYLTLRGQGKKPKHHANHHAKVDEDAADEPDDGGAGKSNRAKKLYYTQRWNGAYPYGGHERATKPIRLDPDIQRYLSAVVPRKNSSVELLTDKEKRLRDGRSAFAKPSKERFEPVTHAEQFQKFARFRRGQDVSGITQHNLELWLTQAHIIDGTVVTLGDLRRICKRFNHLRSFDLETTNMILDRLATRKGLRLPEVIERLCRCGPPKDIDVNVMTKKERPKNAAEERRLSVSNRRKSSGADR